MDNGCKGDIGMACRHLEKMHKGTGDKMDPKKWQMPVRTPAIPEQHQGKMSKSVSAIDKREN